MLERNITFDELDEIWETVDVIEEYTGDIPYPSCLILGFTRSNKPIHAVVSFNHGEKSAIIITVYVPDSKKWKNHFKRRVL